MRPILISSLLSAAALAYPGWVSTFGFTGNTRLDYCSWLVERGVDLTNADIKTGSSKALTIKGKAKRDITEGATAVVSLKLPFLGGPSQEFDFCKDLGVQCPVKDGSTFTATFNVTMKLWPGFSEDNYKVEMVLAQSISVWPPDFVFCVDGPWKPTSSKSIVAQDLLAAEVLLDDAREHWEMK